MNKVELLMPAGDLEILKAAFNNGADAVYLGLNNFNARHMAKNFTHEELKEGLDYAHMLAKKVYVTLNTLVFEDEFEALKKEIDFLYNVGVDALIVQDLGIIEYISNAYPDFELHASTQMHIHNLNGAKFITEHGVKRVVLARETPLSVIKEITSEGIEVETFVHGALCVSYSGQCLMSSFLSDRSANRGMCAQYCRMKYRLIDSKTDEVTNANYKLSMKDLCTIENLKDILDSGVASLKIEGRLKSKEYVSYLAKTYRIAIDNYYNNLDCSIDSKTLDNLKRLFNRGQTEGFISNADPETTINEHRPNHIGVRIGKVVDHSSKRIDIKLSSPVNQFDGIRVLNKKEDQGLILNKIYLNGQLVNSAKAGDIINIYFDNSLSNGDEVYLTKDNNLEKEITKDINTIQFKHQVNGLLYLDGNELTLNINDENTYISKSIQIELNIAKNEIDLKRIEEAITSTGDTPYEFTNLDIQLDSKYFIPLSIVKNLRRQALDLFKEEKIKVNRCSKVEYKYSLKPQVIKKYEIIEDINHNSYTYKLFINEQEVETADYPSVVKEDNKREKYTYQLVSEMGDLYKTNNCIVMPTMNITNSYAMAFLYKLGVLNIFMSYELNDVKYERLLKSFKDKYGFTPNIGYFKSGRIVLMYLKSKIVDNDSTYLLEDLKGRRFPLYIDNRLVTYIYSNVETEESLDKLGIESNIKIYIHF